MEWRGRAVLRFHSLGGLCMGTIGRRIHSIPQSSILFRAQEWSKRKNIKIIIRLRKIIWNGHKTHPKEDMWGPFSNIWSIVEQDSANKKGIAPDIGQQECPYHSFILKSTLKNKCIHLPSYEKSKLAIRARWFRMAAIWGCSWSCWYWWSYLDNQRLPRTRLCPAERISTGKWRKIERTRIAIWLAKLQSILSNLQNPKDKK